MSHSITNSLNLSKQLTASSNNLGRQNISHLGSARSAIQQTELSNFTLPSQKTKARFMNLEPTLRWGEMVSWQLAHPKSQGRQGIVANRMNNKLGWVRKFRDDLGCWRRCQRVIGESLHFIHTQGIFQGACEQLKVRLDKLRQTNWQSCDRSNGLVNQLIAFVLESEKQLNEGEQGWLSTEILESSFGLYKALEGQHSKGGFTSLLAAFPAASCHFGWHVDSGLFSN